MKELTPETKLYLLNQFTGYQYTEAFNIDMNRGCFFCGTDAHKIILIPNKYNFHLGKPKFKLPDVEKIIPVFNGDPKVLNMGDLLSAYINIPMCTYDIILECPSCDGDGNFEHYGEFYACQKCGQTGKLKTGNTESDRDRDMLLKIEETHLQAKYIKLLLRVFEFIALELPDSKCTILYSDFKQMWLMIDDVIIMFGGVLNIEDDPEHIWKVTVFNNQ